MWQPSLPLYLQLGLCLDAVPMVNLRQIPKKREEQIKLQQKRKKLDKGEDQATKDGKKPEKIYKIGVSDSLTGTGAAYGLPGSVALEMARQELMEEGGVEIGGEMYGIELVVYDNKSDATEAVSTVQKLRDIDKVDIMLGWANSTSTLAAVQAIQGQPVMMLVGNGRSPEVMLYSSGNVFRSATANAYNPIADATFIKEELNVGKIAFMAFYNDSAYSGHVANVEKAFGEIGVDIVAKETFNAGENDFLSQMTAIKNSGADAVYMAGNIEESAMSLRQLRELGSNIPVITFSSGTGPQWLEICTNEQMDGCYAIRPAVADPGPKNDLYNEEAQLFIDKYIAFDGGPPSQAATNAYDNFWILMAALKRAGSTEFEEVFNAMWELTPQELDPRVIMPYEAVDGKLFDKLGQAYHPYAVLKWSTDLHGGDWEFDQLIGRNLGAEFYHEWLLKVAEEKGITDTQVYEKLKAK